MKIFKYSFTTIILFILVTTCFGQNIGKKITINPFNYFKAGHKDTSGKNGIVVCAHPLAAKVGLDILMQGGNAIDAAIATQLALAVVYPRAGNLGGGGFMVATIGNEKVALDFREMAPGAAKEDMYLDPKGNPNKELSQQGPFSSGVPGTVAGLFKAMKFSKLQNFETLIQPAIELAEKGFVITAVEASYLNNFEEGFLTNNNINTLPAFVKPKGRWKVGDTLVQKDLARTLERIKNNKRAGFYEGETANLIVDEMTNSGLDSSGRITLDDLKKYDAKWRVPTEFNYREHYHIITMPLPSSGGILLQQMLKILETKPLDKYGFETKKSVQLITEVERRAYADRSKLGDPDFNKKIPVKKIVSRAYLQQRMADYDSTHASKSADIKPGFSYQEGDNTTHISIIDKKGNCASVTTTLNDNYGSKCVVAHAGFILNDEMDDFSQKPGSSNLYGAVGDTPNKIEPYKRMLSSASPTIVLKDGKPFMVVGSPGGTTIITSVLQSIIDVIDYGINNAHEVVNKPKFHHQWRPDRVDVEKDFPGDICKQLQEMGYKIHLRLYWSRTELILVKPGNLYEAAADERGEDDAEGY